MKRIVYCSSYEKMEEFPDFFKGLKKKHDAESLDQIKPDQLLTETIVVIVGGDGTLNYFLNHISNFAHIKVVYFPCGTANDFSKSLKLNATEPSLELLESILNSSPLVNIPVMRCNDKRFINVATGGAPGRVTKSGSDLLKKITGSISYYVNALEGLISANEVTLTYKSNNSEEKEIKTYGFIVSQGLFAGGGVKVTPSLLPSFQEEFFFLTADTEHLTESLGVILKIQNFNQVLYNDPTMEAISTKSLTVKSKSEIPLKLDGEEYSAQVFKFEKEGSSLSFYLY